MRRMIPGMLLLALLIAGSFGMQAVGQGAGKPEQLKLNTLTTDLLRKVVRAHLEGAYGKDRAKEAHVKALTEVLGGTAGIPGKLAYEFKGGKPVVTFDARPQTQPVAGQVNRARAALSDLVGSAFGQVARAGFTDGGKKFTLTAGDARALANAVQIRWAVAPPADPIKPIVTRLDQLAKELAALKGLEKRLAGAEKSVKDLEALKTRVDELGKQLKDLPGTAKALEKLKDVPERLQKVEEAVKNLGPTLKKLEEALKKVEPIAGQVKKLEEQIKSAGTRLDQLEKAAKAIGPRLEKLEKLPNLTPRLQKVEKALGDLEPRLRKLEADLRSVSEEMKKSAAGSSGVLERIKKLEEELKKEREERKRDIQRIDDLFKPKLLPGLPLEPGVLPHCPDGIPILPDCECHADFLPAGGFACSEFLPADHAADHGHGHGHAHYSILAPAVGIGAFHEIFPVLKLMPGPAHGHDRGPHGAALPWPGGPEYSYGPAAFPWHEMPVASRRPAQPAPKAANPAAGRDRLVSRAAPPPASLSKRELATTSKLRRVGHRALDLRGLTAKDAEGLFWQGYRMYWRGEFREALPLFEGAVELYDQDARFWYYRSLTETALGQYEASDDSLARAVELHLRGRPGADLIGRALERVQGEARQHLRKALDTRRPAR